MTESTQNKTQQIWQTKIRPKYRKFRKGTIERYLKFTDFLAKQKKLLHILYLPIILYSFYSIVLEAEQYEAGAVVMVETKSQQAPSESSILTSLTGNLGGQNVKDLRLLVEYIESYSMLQKLDKKLKLKKHYQKQYSLDFISPLKKTDINSFINYYRDLLRLDIDIDSGVLIVKYKDFDKEKSFTILKEILKLSEDFLNEISDEAVNKEVEFYNKSLKSTLSEIRQIKHIMSQEQIASKEISPTQTFETTTKTIAEIEADILKQKAELAQKSSYLNPNSLQVKVAKDKIDKLNNQIKDLKVNTIASDKNDTTFSTVTYATAEMELMLALEKYKLTLQSLETQKFNAVHNAKHLIEVSPPYLPDQALYPKRFTNSFLFTILYFLSLFLVRIIHEIIKEHKYY